MVTAEQAADAREVGELLREMQGSTRDEADSSGWGAPLSFAGFILPEFPVDSLPPRVAAFVRAESIATQTPVDLAAMLSLAALAAASAKRAIVEVKAGYWEPLNLSIAVVLPPAERKSQVLRDVLAAILDYEREQAERLEAEIRRAMQRFKLSEKRLEQAEQRASRTVEREERERLELEAESLSDEHAALVVPSAPRLIADDATPEALVSLLAQHNGAISQFSAEGGIFAMLAGRYSSVPNLDPYLKGHAGDMIRVDRKGRAPEHIAAPALTVGVAVQPGVLDAFAEQPMFRETGLLARFLYALPSSRLGTREVNPPPVPAPVRAAYADALRERLALDITAPITIRFTPAALDAFHVFARWLEPQLSEFGELGSIRDWAGKLCGAIVRISGIVALDSSSKDLSLSPVVDERAFERAATIGRYLVPHALAAFALMGADPKVTGAKHILRCIERNGWTSFTRSQLQQALKGSKRFEHAESLDEPLRILEERGFVRKVEGVRKAGPGRKPTPTYLVNPLSRRINPNNPENGGRA